MTILVLLTLFIVPLAADILLHREHKDLSLREAATWSILYIGMAMIFAGYLAAVEGTDRAGLFLAGYILEKTLSIDNLMIFGVIFGYFGIAPAHRHSVLHWGIIGSVILRLIFVAVGVVAWALMGRVLEVVFGCFVLASVFGLTARNEDAANYDNKWYIRLLRKFVPVTTGDDVAGLYFARGTVGIKAEAWGDGGHTFYDISKMKLAWCITPLFICLVTIEFYDIGFALDSVPTVIAVTRDPVLVYAAIMFAVLGLRSLYFLLEAVTKYLRYLTFAVQVVLVFVGGKLIAHGAMTWDIPARESTYIILAMLGAGAVASLLLPNKEAA